jgi:hypothetical protein
MATYQTNYSANGPARGLPGMIASEEKCNKVSRTVESAGGIEFGQPAFRGTQDNGVVAGAAQTATAAGSAAATNTGAATITAAPVVAAGAKKGRHRLTAISAGATAVFLMSDPDGNELGEVTTGTPATLGGIGPFTITDAGVDPAIGDQFYLDVTFTTNANFVGLAVLTPAVPPAVGAANPDAYPQYFTGAFMTMGPMWVVAGASVKPGERVYWNPATKRYTNNSAHVEIPDTEFDTTAADGGVVRVVSKLRKTR